MWDYVSCIRKQHDARNWALNHRPSDLKSNAQTITPRAPTREDLWVQKSVNPQSSKRDKTLAILPEESLCHLDT